MIDQFKRIIKENNSLMMLLLWIKRILRPIFTKVNISSALKYYWFINDWIKYRKDGGIAKTLDLYPCLNDKGKSGGLVGQYFYQSYWACKHLFQSGTEQHIDIGSDIRFVGHLALVTNVTFVDIRPISLNIDNLTYTSGSILRQPFDDKSVYSMSCLHVIEHIGLGRYGDPIDPEGSNKACVEIRRVLAPGARLYISVPIGRERVQFNGQRIFDVNYIPSMFADFELVDFSYVDGDNNYAESINDLSVVNDAIREFQYGLGMYLLEYRA
jgi:SAM-dependent methyltransferase